jgi:hypothetical protein
LRHRLPSNRQQCQPNCHRGSAHQKGGIGALYSSLAKWLV